MSRSAKIRVLQVIRPAAGGMKQHLKDLLLNLNRDRYELSLTGPIDNELQSLATELGIGVFPLDIHGELTPFNDLKTVFKLQSILRHIRPELVHAHGSKAGLLVRLAILLSQPYRLVLPPRSGPHVLITLHNMVYTGSLSGNKLRFMRFLEVLTAPFVQQFIAVSRSLQDEILQYQSVEPERVITIYNGLDLQKFCNSCHRGVDLREQLGLTGNSLLIGTVARLATQKGVEYFVRMASILAVKNPELTFAVVGDGPLRGELEELAASLPGKPRVHFIGAVSQVQSYLKAMDIFVLPSVSEGFGISVLEAMAMRRPVVATEAGGIPEIIRHEGNGLLVPPGDAMALARGVTWLMEHRSGAAELAEAGYHTVESRFTLEAMIKEIELVYEQSLQTAVGGEFHWQPR